MVDLKHYWQSRISNPDSVRESRNDHKVESLGILKVR